MWFLLVRHFLLLFSREHKMDKQPAQSKKEPIGKRAVLEQLHRSFDQKMVASNEIDGKLQSLLSSASLVVALLSLLQVTILRQQIGITATRAVLISAALLYAGMFGTIWWGIRPRTFYLPISHDWEELAQRYFDESEDTVLDRLIADYLEFGKKNDELISHKSRALRIAMTLFFLAVIVLLAIMALTLASTASTTLTSPILTPTP